VRRLFAIAASGTLHVLAAVTVTSLAATVSLSVPRGDTRPTILVVHVPSELPGRPDERSAPQLTDATPEDLGLHIRDGESTFSLPGFTFNFGKVINRAASLFPFLTGRLSLEHIVAMRRQQGAPGLMNPFAARRRSNAEKPQLVLTDAARQAVLDSSWSRRDRWQAFQAIAKLADAYHPHEGALPRLLREYGVQNGLQPYVDASVRDPRLWTQLGLAADHRDFIDFISQYASRHPSTRATTELLFLLDKLVQASFDALTVMLDTDPVEDLKWTRTANRDAYRAVVRIRDYYRAELRSRNLTSREALRAYYDAARVAVLTTIVDSTPRAYRAGDAAYLIGAIYWKQGRIADAVDAWREIVAHSGDGYVAAYSEILAEIRKPDSQPLDNRQISRVLEGEHGRWLVLSSERLQQFGYHFDTF
jgi:hypothetical protein